MDVLGCVFFDVFVFNKKLPGVMKNFGKIHEDTFYIQFTVPYIDIYIKYIKYINTFIVCSCYHEEVLKASMFKLGSVQNPWLTFHKILLGL